MTAVLRQILRKAKRVPYREKEESEMVPHTRPQLTMNELIALYEHPRASFDIAMGLLHAVPHAWDSDTSEEVGFLMRVGSETDIYEPHTLLRATARKILVQKMLGSTYGDIHGADEAMLCVVARFLTTRQHRTNEDRETARIAHFLDGCFSWKRTRRMCSSLRPLAIELRQWGLIEEHADVGFIPLLADTLMKPDEPAYAWQWRGWGTFANTALTFPCPERRLSEEALYAPTILKGDLGQVKTLVTRHVFDRARHQEMKVLLLLLARFEALITLSERSVAP